MLVRFQAPVVKLERVIPLKEEKLDETVHPNV